MDQLRCLQIIQEALRNHTQLAHTIPLISSTPTIPSYSSFTFDPLLPYLLEALQMPCQEIRSASLQCIGLLTLSQSTSAQSPSITPSSMEYSQQFLEIILQIIQTVQEDSLIRCQGIEVVCDLIMVQGGSATPRERGVIIQEDRVIHLFKRFIQSEDHLICSTIVESCCKLLLWNHLTPSFSSISQSSSSELLAQLIVVFFTTCSSSLASTSPEEDSDEAEDEDDETETVIDERERENQSNQSKKGTKEYIDQLLSIFFSSYCQIITEELQHQRLAVLYESIGDVIIEYSRRLKNEMPLSCTLQKMIDHVLSWCQSLISSEPNEISRSMIAQMKKRICAILFKELLSLSPSVVPAHKKVMNELGKIFPIFTPCHEWIQDEKTKNIVATIAPMIQKQCKFDRATLKYWNEFLTSSRELEIAPKTSSDK